jgi:hypothetical protein
MNRIHLGLFIILVCLLSLGQLQRISLGPLTALYVHELLISVWTVLLVVQFRQRLVKIALAAIQRIVRNKLFIVMTLLILGGWGRALYTGTFFTWTLLFTLRLGIYLGWGWLMSQTKVISQNWWLLGFLAAGLLICMFGVYQYFFIPDTRFIRILGWDDHYYRLISTQLDPNFTGLLLSITLLWLWNLPFSWWQWLIHGLNNTQLNYVRKIATVGLTLLLIMTILVTFSRSSLVSLIVGIITFFSFQKISVTKQNFKTVNYVLAVVLTISLAVGTLIIAPKPSGEGINWWRTSTINARIINTSNWMYSLEPYQLILGRGLFVPPLAETLSSTSDIPDHANLPDNLIVLSISSLGIVGSIGLGWMLMKWFRSADLNPGSLAILTTVLIHSMFNNSLLQVFVLLFVLATLVEKQLESTT